MDSENLNLHDAPAQQCAKCKEYGEEIDAYGTLLLILAFIGPIVGMLIGLFAGKKLMGK